MPPSVDQVMRRFGELRMQIASLHTEEFLNIDVTMSQAQLLYIAAAQPDMSVSAIASRLNVGLSAASGLVDRLVEHGYLVRREDPSDRRQHLIAATDEGLRVIDRLRELDDALVRRLLGGLDGPELEGLDRGIAALTRQAARLAATDTSAREIHRPERTAR